MKHNNIYTMGIPEGKESEHGIKNLFKEIMTKNFPNLVEEKTLTSRKCRVPKEMYPKKPTWVSP